MRLRWSSRARRLHRPLAAAFCALAVALPQAAPSAAASTARPGLAVQGGRTVTVRVPGILAADSSDATVAQAGIGGPDTLSITGVGQGAATIVAVTADDVISIPVSVSAPPPPATARPGYEGAAGFLTLRYLPLPQLWDASLEMPRLTAAVSPGAWWAAYAAPGLSIRAASVLPTPLSDLGAPLSAGLQATIEQRWSVTIASPASSVAVSLPFSGGALSAGISTAGAFATSSWAVAPLSIKASAWMSPAGPRAMSDVSAALGSVTVGARIAPSGWFAYAAIAPRGSSVTAGIGPGGAWALSLQTGVGGGSVSLSLSSSGLWTASLVLPLGPDASLSASASPSGASGQYADVPASYVQTTVPSAGATLLVGQSSVPQGVPAPPALAASWPFTIWGATASSSLSPAPTAAVNRAALALTAPLSPQPPASVAVRLPIATGQPQRPAAPAPSPPAAPTGLLIVRICAAPPGSLRCSASDTLVATTASIDGAPRDVTLPVAVPPGPHTVTLSPDDIPPLFTPLAPLSCSVTIDPSGLAECDFPLQRAGRAPTP